MADTVRTWTIIPARGGSKGIPGKNLALVQSRSLVRRAVDAARGAARVDRVFVSTDAADIAAEAVRAGAEIVERPADISGDASSSEDALLHALDIIWRNAVKSFRTCSVSCNARRPLFRLATSTAR